MLDHLSKLADSRRSWLIAATAALLVIGVGTCVALSASGGQHAATQAANVESSATMPRPEPPTTSILASTTLAPPSTIAATTLPTEQEPSPPTGVAAQVHFGLGGAGGRGAPTCSDGETVNGAIVSFAATIPLMEPAIVCFPQLAVDAPVDVVITSPDGSATPATASPTTDYTADGAEAYLVQTIDFSRGESDPVGTYTVEATQGDQVVSVPVSVVEPPHPVVDVVNIDDDSIDVIGAGFPPSQPIGIHLYREEVDNDPDFEWIRSIDLISDTRGHTGVHVPLSPTASDLDLYGLITTPDAIAREDRVSDYLGHLVFSWPA